MPIRGHETYNRYLHGWRLQRKISEGFQNRQNENSETEVYIDFANSEGFQNRQESELPQVPEEGPPIIIRSLVQLKDRKVELNLKGTFEAEDVIGEKPVIKRDGVIRIRKGTRGITLEFPSRKRLHYDLDRIEETFFYQRRKIILLSEAGFKPYAENGDITEKSTEQKEE